MRSAEQGAEITHITDSRMFWVKGPLPKKGRLIDIVAPTGTLRGCAKVAELITASEGCDSAIITENHIPLAVCAGDKIRFWTMEAA